MNAFTPIDKDRLSYLDWKVVEMGREDGPRSLKPDGFVAGLARFFGADVAHGLENDRLEALRRFSVRAWYWDLIRTKDVQAFLDAGFSRIHVLEILSHVGMARGFIPTVQEPLERVSKRDRTSRSRSRCRCG
jgi:hypothetical protein